MDQSEELGPEILEMKISIAGWCFADKKMVLWMDDDSPRFNYNHYITADRQQRHCSLCAGNQRSNCWVFIIRETTPQQSLES